MAAVIAFHHHQPGDGLFQTKQQISPTLRSWTDNSSFSWTNKTGSLESINIDCEEIEESGYGSAGSNASPRPESVTPIGSVVSGSLAESIQNQSIDEQFTGSLGYATWQEIIMYYRLNNWFVDEIGNAQCSRSVNRFGSEYPDPCRFPLVLPVFTGEMLHKPKGKYIKWERLMLEADACLAQWELSAVRNLWRRFQGSVAIGPATDWITVDPNHQLRRLEQELNIPESRAKHQALKRWTSMEDLTSNSSLRSQKKPASRTDTDLVMIRSQNTTKSTVVVSKANVSFRKRPQDSCRSFRSNDSFNNLIASAESTTDCRSLYGQLIALLEHSTPIHFSLYVTKLHQEHFRSRINVTMLASLALPSLAITQRSNLAPLLHFDDTVVAVVRDYLRSKTTGNHLANLIEVARILQQLRNYHGLTVMVGAIQAPGIFFTSQWISFRKNYYAHFRDFVRLSQLCRLLARPGAMLSCVGAIHLPPICSILNRIRLFCATTWNLCDAQRRFVRHPFSVAEWVEQETRNRNRTEPTGFRFSQGSPAAVQILQMDQFSDHIRRRSYLGTMPDRILRMLVNHGALQTWIQSEIDQSFGFYRLPEKFY